MAKVNDAEVRSHADYIINNNATVRMAATAFGISKSTIHSHVTEQLRKLDLKLYFEVRKVLDKNKAERHIRGGAATKAKYQKKT